VLGHFADLDHAYTREQVDALEAELRGAGVDVEFFWYPGTDHAFFNDTRPEVFDSDASRLAWERTRAFFRTHLATTVAPV
jgi:carboxymethylenebutenolidase